MAKHSPNNLTRENSEKLMLYEGVSISTLAELFGMDKRKISAMIAGVPPAGERKGFPIYRIRDVASRLAVPSEKQIVETIKRMPMQKLPVQMQKEFWDAARSRQTFEENANDLWRTETVIVALTEILKTVRTSITLMQDMVARETELSDRQRNLIESAADGLLEDLHARVQNNPVFEGLTNTFEESDFDPDREFDFGLGDDDDDGLD